MSNQNPQNETLSNEELLLEWDTVNRQKTDLAQQEIVLRFQVAEQVFGWSENDLGTGGERYPLLQGYAAKLTRKINVSVDQNKIETTLAKLDEAGVPNKLLASLFRAKYSLSAKPFSCLEPSQQAIVQEILTKKPGTPSLEITSPKGSK